MKPVMLALAGSALVAGCSNPSTTAYAEPDLFERISMYCGKAFAGSVTSQDARDAAFATQTLIMHVRECSDDEIHIPFHVGEDRSRTWVLTRLEQGGLRLKHDHRHEDGHEDVLTWYGGDTVEQPSVERAEFPADAHSQALFEREEIPVSMANVWSITLSEEAFTYALDRPDRHFAARFDLTRTVPAPPAPWGFED